MKKTLLTLTTAAMAVGSAQAVQIFSDDFEAYTAGANPSDNPLDSDLFDLNNVIWTPSSTANNAHRIFGTALYGATQLWITLVDGTSLSSSGLDIQSDMTYTLDFFSAAETSTVNRALTGSVDILVGTDIGTATTVIGGPQTFTALNDADATLNGNGDGTVGDKTDHMHQYAFDSGTVGAGSKMFMVFTRGGLHPGALNTTDPWFALDDVSVDEVATVPEPSSTALLGLGALGFMLRRRR